MGNLDHFRPSELLEFVGVQVNGVIFIKVQFTFIPGRIHEIEIMVMMMVVVVMASNTY